MVKRWKPGPHEGKELRLMLAGQKPVAMFYDSVPETEGIIPRDDFAPHVASGRLISHEVVFEHDWGTVVYVFYALPEARESMMALVQHEAEIHAGRGVLGDEGDRIEGRLLGYSEEDIERFIEWKKRK